MKELISYADGVHAVDSGYGRPQLAAIHIVVQDGRAAIVDTGSNASVPQVLGALAALGLAELAQQLDALAIGQAHVGDDGVKAVGLELFARLLDAGCGLHPIAFAQQGQFVQGAQVGFVVHDEDGGGSGRGGAHVSDPLRCAPPEADETGARDDHAADAPPRAPHAAPTSARPLAPQSGAPCPSPHALRPESRSG